jgi:dienelactone hydrolase
MWFGDVRQARRTSREDMGGYYRYELEIPIEIDFRQKHLLLVPKAAPPTPRPAVICWTSTTPDWREPENWWGEWLAGRGYVVLTSWAYIRHYRHGSTIRTGAQELVHQRFGRWMPLAKMAHDARRQYAYLASMPEVDPGRVGFMGFSLSAKAAVYVAAFVPEIAATVSVDPGLPLRGNTNWGAPWYLDWDREFADIDTPEKTVKSLIGDRDHDEVVALAAPRPFLLLGGGAERHSDGVSTQPLMERAREAYRAAGAGSNIEWALTRDGHAANGPRITPAWQEFIEKHLGGR